MEGTPVKVIQWGTTVKYGTIASVLQAQDES